MAIPSLSVIIISIVLHGLILLVQALTLVREFIFGNNQTGLVTNTNSGSVTVIGGEVPSLGNEILTGQAGIYYGSATTASTYFFPTATVEAWNEISRLPLRRQVQETRQSLPQTT